MFSAGGDFFEQDKGGRKGSKKINFIIHAEVIYNLGFRMKD